jgi:MOSC domain-containing protein YiiM
MIVRSVNVGTPAPMQAGERAFMTAIRKEPRLGPLWLSPLGFEGDQQADLRYHGGPDQAALVYAHEHYPYWRESLGFDLAPGAFGENLTVEGLTEESACIGDIYRIGGAAVQVTCPRIPCFKLAVRLGVPDMIERVSALARGGLYLRVLEEGAVAAGDTAKLQSRPPGAPTVAETFRIRVLEPANLAGARRLLAAEGLSETWRRAMRKRLKQGAGPAL